jgi:hypothetical protein
MNDHFKASQTQEVGTKAKPSVNALFLKYPQQYKGYALQWAMHPKWTIEEAANLLSACVPHREMLLPGSENEQLDKEILAMENRIRRAWGKGLDVIKSKKYFSTVYIDHITPIHWAKKNTFPYPTIY